jgi:hypothetical protein
MEHKAEGVCIPWVYGEDVVIEWERMDTPYKLLEWVEHLCGKTGCTPERIAELISLVCEHWGWDIHTLC